MTRSIICNVTVCWESDFGWISLG